ncbi:MULTISPECIES: Lsr2 family DNA-binding protein [unclassified Microbacterium]|uniref:Lsr2 family DNA-binding protein n=1 Tax=unclassified Microbacterium TaxID=2609290 RepID=UPI003015F2B0
MSTVELPSGVRHGTPEGHLAGCKGERTECPALLEHGMSCTYAYVRSTTTPDRYYKAKARNPEPREIARTLGFKPTPRAAALAAVFEADATLPSRIRKPVPPRERTAPMPEPIEPTADEQATDPVIDDAEQAPAPEEPAGPSTGQIRDWAKTAGIAVPVRGPIPKPVAIAYDLAHSRELASDTSTQDTPATAPATPTTTLTMADFTRGLSQSATRERGRQIRAWLRTHGYPGLSDRGIVPPSGLYAYLLEHPGATDPAQPLAEQSHDPRGNTPAPAADAAAAPAKSTTAEGEDMGHPQHAEATEELIDQIRDRIDMPKPAPPAPVSEARAAAGIQTPAPTIPPAGRTLTDAPGPRPEWAEVTTSNEVTAALADRDAALEQRDQARSLAARLWEQLDATEERARIAEAALELTLTRWDTATTELAAARRAGKFLFRRLAAQEAELRDFRILRTRLARAAAGWQLRATNLQTALDDARIAAPARRPDGAIPGAPLTPARRSILPWKKHTR